MNVTDLQGAGLFTPYDELDCDTIAEIKCRLMDTIMALIGGALAVPAEEYEAICSLADGAPLYRPVYPAEHKTSLEMAAFLNAFLIRYADWGDTYRRNGGIGGHPSDSIAAILAIGDIPGASGRDMIELTNLSYQLWAGMQETMLYKRKDIDYTTTLSLVIPVVASVAFDEPPEQIQNALNLSAAGGVILEQVRPGDITNLKSAASAYAIARALWCCRLGSAIKAPASMFDGKYGWYNAIMPADGELRGRGKESYNSVEIKNFACFNGAQAAVECAVGLHPKLNGRVDGVKKISVCVSKVDITVVKKSGSVRYPNNQSEADHHLKYCTATALLYGGLTPLHYSDKFLEDDNIKHLIDKMDVRVLSDEEAASLNNQDGACMVAVEMDDGSSFTHSVSRAAGILRDIEGEERIARLKKIIEGKRKMVEDYAKIDLSPVSDLVFDLENHSGRELIERLQSILQAI